MVNGGRNKRKGSSSSDKKGPSTGNDADPCGRCGPENGEKCGIPGASNTQKPRKSSKDSSGSGSSGQYQGGSKQKAGWVDGKAKHGKGHVDACPRPPHKSQGTQTDFDKEVQCDLPLPRELEKMQTIIAEEDSTQTEQNLRDLCEMDFGKLPPASAIGAQSVQAQPAISAIRAPQPVQAPLVPSAGLRTYVSAQMQPATQTQQPIQAPPVLSAGLRAPVSARIMQPTVQTQQPLYAQEALPGMRTQVSTAAQPATQTQQPLQAPAAPSARLQTYVSAPMQPSMQVQQPLQAPMAPSAGLRPFVSAQMQPSVQTQQPSQAQQSQPGMRTVVSAQVQPTVQTQQSLRAPTVLSRGIRTHVSAEAQPATKTEQPLQQASQQLAGMGTQISAAVQPSMQTEQPLQAQSGLSKGMGTNISAQMQPLQAQSGLSKGMGADTSAQMQAEQPLQAKSGLSKGIGTYVSAQLQPDLQTQKSLQAQSGISKGMRTQISAQVQPSVQPPEGLQAKSGLSGMRTLQSTQVQPAASMVRSETALPSVGAQTSYYPAYSTQLQTLSAAPAVSVQRSQSPAAPTVSVQQQPSAARVLSEKGPRSVTASARAPSPSIQATPGILSNQQGVPPIVQSSAIPPHPKCCTDKNEKNCVDCTPFEAQDHPLMLRYKAIVVDAKPTIQHITPSGIAQYCQAPPPPPRPPSVAPTVVRDPTIRSVRQSEQKADEVDDAFGKLIDRRMPVIWIFGLTPIAAAFNKRHCLETIAQRNSLRIVELDKELEKFKDFSSVSASSSREPKGLLNVINFRGRKLAQKVINEGSTLTNEEICQLIKLTFVSNMQAEPKPRGFILDCFPLNTEEGMAVEDNVIKSVCGLYFLNIKWSTSKAVEPKVSPLKYNFRAKPYSEKEAEAAADYFGFKTIKILNAEDLEDIQINDINALVTKHIEGHGLELHKVTKQAENGDDPGPSYVLMDHHDFVSEEEGSSSGPYSSAATASQYPPTRISKPVTGKATGDVSVLYNNARSIGVSSVFPSSEPRSTEPAESFHKSAQSFWND